MPWHFSRTRVTTPHLKHHCAIGGTYSERRHPSSTFKMKEISNFLHFVICEEHTLQQSVRPKRKYWNRSCAEFVYQVDASKTFLINRFGYKKPSPFHSEASLTSYRETIRSEASITSYKNLSAQKCQLQVASTYSPTVLDQEYKTISQPKRLVEFHLCWNDNITLQPALWRAQPLVTSKHTFTEWAPTDHQDLIKKQLPARSCATSQNLQRFCNDVSLYHDRPKTHTKQNEDHQETCWLHLWSKRHAFHQAAASYRKFSLPHCS